MKHRIVSVSFLNAKPLVYELEKYNNLSVRHEVPSKCAEILRNREADCGLIPVIEYTKNYSVVPGICISSEKKAASVLLLGNKPITEMKSVSLDPASRTSAALIRVLFHCKYGIEPEFCLQGTQTDGVLLIGDRALAERNSHPFVYDLAHEWREWQNLPFVFAFWAGWKESLSDDLVVSLTTTRNSGMRNISKIAGMWAENNNEPPAFYADYLTDNINYYLDDQKIKAIRLFYELAQEQGILAEIPELEFY